MMSPAVSLFSMKSMNIAAASGCSVSADMEAYSAGLKYMPVRSPWDSPGHRMSLISLPAAFATAASWLVHSGTIPPAFVATSDRSGPTVSSSTVVDAGG
jgi:hypothetical protein